MKCFTFLNCNKTAENAQEISSVAFLQKIFSLQSFCRKFVPAGFLKKVGYLFLLTENISNTFCKNLELQTLQKVFPVFLQKIQWKSFFRKYFEVFPQKICSNSLSAKSMLAISCCRKYFLYFLQKIDNCKVSITAQSIFLFKSTRFTKKTGMQKTCGQVIMPQ